MGSIMRSAVNQGSISRDRLSLPETIYWIPRSKWAFLLFSSIFGELFRGSVRPLGACGAPLFPSFTHENSFLSLPTSASPLPQCLPKVFPPLLHCHTKPTSWFQLWNQGGSPGFYLQVFGGRQGRGGGGEWHILEEIKFVQRNEAEERIRCLLICVTPGHASPHSLFLTKNSASSIKSSLRCPG